MFPKNVSFSIISPIVFSVYERDLQIPVLGRTADADPLTEEQVEKANKSFNFIWITPVCSTQLTISQSRWMVQSRKAFQSSSAGLRKPEMLGFGLSHYIGDLEFRKCF